MTNAVEIREKATEVALSLVSGAYQTSLISYLTHLDLFPALMKVITLIYETLRELQILS